MMNYVEFYMFVENQISREMETCALTCQQVCARVMHHSDVLTVPLMAGNLLQL